MNFTQFGKCRGEANDEKNIDPGKKDENNQKSPVQQSEPASSISMIQERREFARALFEVNAYAEMIGQWKRTQQQQQQALLSCTLQSLKPCFSTAFYCAI